MIQVGEYREKLAITREQAACNDPGRRIKGEADEYQGAGCLQ
jgi:hypothetical protein